MEEKTALAGAPDFDGTCAEKLDYLIRLTAMQNKYMEELLRQVRHADMAASFAVDAVNGLYGILGKAGARQL